MDIKEAAALLDGNEYRNEGSKSLFEQMKANHLVAVFGASDDIMEFRGAIHDEEYPSEEPIYINERGIIRNECEEEECPYHKRSLPGNAYIKALWCDEPDISWTYETEIPHEKFLIMEEDEVYCRGIVFSLRNLR